MVEDHKVSAGLPERGALLVSWTPTVGCCSNPGDPTYYAWNDSYEMHKVPDFLDKGASGPYLDGRRS